MVYPDLGLPLHPLAYPGLPWPTLSLAYPDPGLPYPTLAYPDPGPPWPTLADPAYPDISLHQSRVFEERKMEAQTTVDNSHGSEAQKVGNVRNCRQETKGWMS